MRLLTVIASLDIGLVLVTTIQVIQTGSSEVLNQAVLIAAVGGLFGVLGAVARSLHLALVASLKEGHQRELSGMQTHLVTLVGTKDEVIAALQQTIAALNNRVDTLDNRLVGMGQAQQQQAAEFHASVDRMVQTMLEHTTALRTLTINIAKEHRELIQLAKKHTTTPPAPLPRRTRAQARAGA